MLVMLSDFVFRFNDLAKIDRMVRERIYIETPPPSATIGCPRFVLARGVPCE